MTTVFEDSALDTKNENLIGQITYQQFNFDYC